MSRQFLVSLAAAVAAIVGTRLVLRRAVVPQLAGPVDPGGAVLGVLGVACLVLHCTAMFFPRMVAPLPGAALVMPQIRALGTTSAVWFVVPCLLVLLALRRLHPAPLLVLAAALVAVGVTMYDGSRLAVHLTAIFVAVVVLTATVAGLAVRPPRDVAARP